jgi:DNA-binding MarR family transcriptional regulator
MMNRQEQAAELRLSVLGFIRAMGLLQVKETPCGQPLSVPQAHTLLFLRGQPEGAEAPSQQALADHLALDKSTITRLVRKMSDQDLLVLSPCPNDKRAKRLNLTEKGERMGGQVERASLALFAGVVSALPTSDPSSIAKAVNQLVTAIQHTRSQL